MARQLSDLPQMQGNEISNEDLLLIRDVSSVSDKNIKVKDILLAMYPIGSVYSSVSLSTPEQVASALGGTWEAWGSGRVPVGVDTNDESFNTVEKTGGEKTHKLTTSEMPKHKHTHSSGRWAWSEQSGGGDIINSQSETSHMFTRDTSEVGGDTAHNNLQPYITCYMYKRIA